MMINTIEGYEKYLEELGQTLTQKERKAWADDFEKGRYFYSPDEAEKQGWIIRPDALRLYNDIYEELKNSYPLLSNRSVIGFRGVPKPMYVHHWSKEEPNSPWDFIVKFDRPVDMTFCIDVKGSSAQRVSIQPKYGQMPDIAGKVREARAQKWMPFYAFKNPDDDIFYYYPLSEEDYLTTIKSNPYTPKMVKLSSPLEELMIFWSMADYRSYHEELGKPARKPAIINIFDAKKGEYV